MKKFSKYLIELIVIVVGITLSFMVDEWREERQKREDVHGALSLMLYNLQSDSVQLQMLLDFSKDNRKHLEYLLSSHESMSDTMLLDIFWSTWSVAGRVTIQKSGLSNLYSIQGSKYVSSDLHILIDKYYNETYLDHNLLDWHLSNRRIDDFKWMKFKNYNDLMLLVEDTTYSYKEKEDIIASDEVLKSNLNEYFNNPDLLNLVADKYIMARMVGTDLKRKLKNNRELNYAIQKELQD